MSLAAFVDDSDMLVVHLRETRISGAEAFVEKQMMRFRPGHAVIEADLNGVMSSSLLRMRIGEHQSMTCLTVAFVGNSQQTAVAVGFDQSVAACRMVRPGLTKIFSHRDSSKAFLVVADVEHNRVIIEQHGLAFIAAAVSGITDGPRLPMVAADHHGCKCGERFAAGATLNRHGQRSVGHLKA